MKHLDRYRGCLVGGAVGDALGYAVEFLDEGAIFGRFGGSGITEYELVGGMARISDDTQMTLFTANGLLLGTTRGMTRGIMGSYPSYVACCYKDWLRTQEDKYPLDVDDLEAIHALGEGWVAEETLAIAVFCALRHHDDFEGAIVAAVNHRGDSDSTGAVAGNIVGAHVGLSGIPDRFVESLELRDTIVEMADDLYNDCQISEYGEHEDKVWESKYIYRTYPRAFER